MQEALHAFVYVGEDGIERYVQIGQLFDADAEPVRRYPDEFCDQGTPHWERPDRAQQVAASGHDPAHHIDPAFPPPRRVAD